MYKRNLSPATTFDHDALTRAMVGIGMNFAADPLKDQNIEDTLLAASQAALRDNDLRTLSVLMTWLHVHHRVVIVERLTKLVVAVADLKLRAFWCSVARSLQSDKRFAKLAQIFDEAVRVELLPVGTEFQVRRHGIDPRFAQGPLVVPAGTLRDRLDDVLTPTKAARLHTGYRYRVQMGPSYRADMWAALDTDARLHAAALARKTYGSYATAHDARRDWQTLHDAATSSTTSRSSSARRQRSTR